MASSSPQEEKDGVGAVDCVAPTGTEVQLEVRDSGEDLQAQARDEQRRTIAE